MSDELIDADPGGHGLVRLDTDAAQMSMTTDGWTAHAGSDDIERGHVTASSSVRDIHLHLSFDDVDGENRYWTGAQLTPQAALRLVEQLLTATKYALTEDHWSPEYAMVEFDYDLAVLEDDTATGGDDE